MELTPSPREFRGLDVSPYFCDEIEEEIAAKQLLVEWHQSQISTASPAEKAAHNQRIKQLQQEIQRLVQQLEVCLQRPPALLVIAGVEQTQATQYFFINGRGKEFGSNFAPNNSVPIISHRDLILRVYVDDRRPPSLLPRWVSARVRYGHDDLPQTSVLNALNGSIPARPVAAVDRGKIGDTLNFRIPAYDCHDTLRITVDIFDPQEIDPVVGLVATDIAKLPPQQVITPTDSVTFYVHTQPVPDFQVRAVFIRYTGGGLDLPAPSWLDFASHLLFTLDAFPISRLILGDCFVYEWDGDLGSGEAAWQLLLARLYELNHYSTEILVGLVPDGVPGSVQGIGGDGVAIAIARRTPLYGRQESAVVLAHEIGHVLGRKHAPPRGDDIDPNYPNYNNSIPGTIGEFGVSRADLKVISPRGEFGLDIMAYANYPNNFPGWVSPYTYVGLLHGMILRWIWPALSLPGSAWLYLAFSIDRDGPVTVQPSFVREAPAAPPVGFGPTPISCELVDAGGRVLHWQRCTLRDPYQRVEGPTLFFYEAMPWFSTARTIRFRRVGELVGEIDIEDVEPRVVVTAPEVGRSKVTVEWHAEHPGHLPLAYLVEYSNDNGRTWRTVARTNRTRFDVDPDFMAGGEQCRFRVLASSGVRTASAQSEAFAVPQRPRRAFILSPEPDQQIAVGQDLVLRGGGFAPGLGLTNLEETLWMSSVDGTLGYGHEVVCRLSEGLHKITLTVPDGLGRRASAEVTVIVRSRAFEDVGPIAPR